MINSTENLRLIKYTLLQTTIVPSLMCDLLIFLHFILHWRKEIVIVPQNHTILCLLTINFLQKTTDVPFTIYFYRWGISYRQTYSFCIIWNWLNYSLTTINLQLVTWCCIERHLFIFHGQLMKNKWCLILLHYIPLIVCLFYTPSFYLRFIFFSSTCTNIWDYTSIYCGDACYSHSNPLVGTFDWIFNYGLPTLIIIFANLLLLFRVIWRKMKDRRPIQWKRHKRMIFQLNFISLLYFIFMTPHVIVGSIQTLWDSTFLMNIQKHYFYYIVYFINQLVPFVIISSLPEMCKDFKRWIAYMKRYFDCRGQAQQIFVITADRNRRGTVAHTI